MEVEAQRHGQAPTAKHGFCEGLDRVFVEPLPLRASVADMRRTYLQYGFNCCPNCNTSFVHSPKGGLGSVPLLCDLVAVNFYLGS